MRRVWWWWCACLLTAARRAPKPRTRRPGRAHACGNRSARRECRHPRVTKQLTRHPPLSGLFVAQMVSVSHPVGELLVHAVRAHTSKTGDGAVAMLAMITEGLRKVREALRMPGMDTLDGPPHTRRLQTQTRTAPFPSFRRRCFAGTTARRRRVTASGGD